MLKFIQHWRGTAIATTLASVPWMVHMDLLLKILVSAAVLVLTIINAMHTYEQWRLKRAERKRLLS